MNAFVTASVPGLIPSPTSADEALDTLAASQPGLAAAFRVGWDQPAAAWAAQQFAPTDSAAFEGAFRRALVAELALRPDLDGGSADALVGQVEAGGAVLTPHHVCPTPGPTFGAIDQLACLGSSGPILVLAWSGVPMSNSARSGALCFSQAPFGALLREGTPEFKSQRQAAKDRARDGIGEQRITLVPSAARDALLYECPLPERLLGVLDSATPELRALMPDPLEAERYPAWAARMAEAMQRQVLSRDNLFYVDLNSVARRYLLEVLDDAEHPVTRLLTTAWDDPAPFPEMSWFYGRREGKRQKVLTYGASPDDLRGGLARGELCPGLVPVFGALRLLSRITLLGGYRQVGYLEAIAESWLEAGIVDADHGVPGRLLTGRMAAPSGPIYPLDLALGATDRGALPTADTPMSALWAPLLPRVQANAG